jgi:predicted Co/Zn/Cd cation transporter (cation efflux family)
VDKILSWTPAEYKAFIKGAMHAEVDQYQFAARSALMNRVAQNSKHITEKKIFDAEKAHKRVEQGSKDYKDSKEVVSLDLYRQAKKDMAGYMKQFKRKEA